MILLRLFHSLKGNKIRKDIFTFLFVSIHHYSIIGWRAKRTTSNFISCWRVFVDTLIFAYIKHKIKNYRSAYNTNEFDFWNNKAQWRHSYCRCLWWPIMMTTMMPAMWTEITSRIRGECSPFICLKQTWQILYRISTPLSFKSSHRKELISVHNVPHVSIFIYMRPDFLLVFPDKVSLVIPIKTTTASKVTSTTCKWPNRPKYIYFIVLQKLANWWWEFAKLLSLVCRMSTVQANGTRVGMHDTIRSDWPGGEWIKFPIRPGVCQLIRRFGFGHSFLAYLSGYWEKVVSW